jgi:hypothetical protein
MNKSQFYTCLAWLITISTSCTTTRKSEKYYQENKVAINELRSYYDTLYRQQPFSTGFTDKSFQYYVMQINTDTLRAIYTTDTRKQELWENVQRFHYDTVLLKKLAAKMKEVKCLWLSKTTYYMGEQPVPFTYISFGSALIETPFVENKYYILVFLDHKVDHPDMQARINSGQLVPLDDLVYFTIGSSYR